MYGPWEGTVYLLAYADTAILLALHYSGAASRSQELYWSVRLPCQAFVSHDHGCELLHAAHGSPAYHLLSMGTTAGQRTQSWHAIMSLRTDIFLSF